MFKFAPVSDRIKGLRAKRDWADNGHIRINSERTKIYTDYYKTHEAEHPLLKRAHCLYEWCSKKALLIEDDDLFIGNMAPTFRGLCHYIEWNTKGLEDAVNDTDENFRAAWQSKGTVYMSDEDREIFREAVAYWKDRTITARMTALVPQAIFDIRGNGVTDFATRYDFLSDRAMGHYVANHEKAIRSGFAAVKKEALSKMAEMEGRAFGNNARKYTFYRALVIVCDAYITLAKRYGAFCREKAMAANGRRKSELLKMAGSLEWISENPARTYWEALEIIILYQMILIADAQQHGLSFGRVDQYTGDLLQAELDAGTISRDEAQELTDAFILKIADHVNIDRFPPNKMTAEKSGTDVRSGTPGTAGQHLTVGGMKKDGTDAANAATLMFLQTYGRLYIPDPSISCRIHGNTPDSVWQLAVECSKIAGGIPTLENDDVIIPGLEMRGLSKEDARNYSIVGCVEPVGTGCEWPACGNTGLESFWCMAGCIPLAINDGNNPATGSAAGIHCGYLYEMNDFEQFKNAFEKQVHYFLDWHITFCNFYELMYSENFPCIAASTMMEGCMESGLDVTCGGAKYNSTGLTALGIANVADSLMAIKRLCFDTKRYSTREMFDALAANWKGYEDMRQTVINNVPHYGNDVDEVDELAAWAMGLFADHMNNAEGPRGKYRGGTFTMTTHIPYGLITGATPDGRKKGEPLAEAISARQGFDKSGPTAAMNSAARLPHINLLNGDQLNIKFSPASVKGDEGTRKLRDLIQVYFDQNGMQVQFNVVSTDTLYDAQKNPDRYRNLIVRIAGFSAYFVEMPKVLQDDFISRTEQAL